MAMNATTKDLARIAASVARESTSRASRVDEKKAQRNSGQSIRSALHATAIILLGLAVVVLAFKWSEERALRRQAEARLTQVIASRPQATLLGERATSWPMSVPADLRAIAARTVASQAAVTSSAGAAVTAGTRASDL